MLIKCTMREGITEAAVEGYRYTFRPDGEGNPICSITKQSHIDILLGMGPHCYVVFSPEKNIKDMNAKEIFALPDGVGEEEKKELRRQIAEAEKADKQRAEAQKKKDLEGRIEKLEKGQREEMPPDVTHSAAAGLAETRIAEIIKSFKTLGKDRFESWLEANHDQIAAMPPDVKIELAKKIKKNWPDKDPEIPGLDLEKYGKPSTDTTGKGHSNINK